MEPSDTVYGDKFARLNGDGLLELDFGPNGRGDGLGTDSVYEFDDVFTVTNQGTQPVYVWATFDTSDFGDGAVWLYPGSDSETKLNDGENSVVQLAVGETLHVGIHVDTTNVDLGEQTLGATINASANLPGSSSEASNPGEGPFAPTAPDDYVAYYPLDGDADDEGGGNDGTETGGVGFESGKIGQAATFDDSGDQHVELADGSTFGYDTFSVSVWAKVSDTDAGLRTVIARQDPVEKHDARTFVVWFDDDDAFFGAEVVTSRLSVSGTNRDVTADDETYTDGNWHHVVMTVDGGNEMKLYVDGLEKGSQSLGGDPYTGDAETWLGQEPGRDDRPLDGSVDDVRIYDRVLSATEVDALYNDV
jgi:hypothetical protein